MDVLLYKKNHVPDKSALKEGGKPSKRFLFKAENIIPHLEKKVLQ